MLCHNVVNVADRYVYGDIALHGGRGVGLTETTVPMWLRRFLAKLDALTVTGRG